MFQSSTTYFWASFLAIWIVAVANPVPQDLVNERNQVPDENTFLPDSGSLNFQSSLEFGIDSPSQIDPIELAEISNPTNENDYANAPTNCPKTSMLNGNDEIDPTMNVFRRKAAMCPPITQQNDQKPNYSPSVNPVRKVWNKLTDTDDIKYSCDKNSKRNKLVTCTGPEYQGEHPIGKVLNCVKGAKTIISGHRYKGGRWPTTTSPNLAKYCCETLVFNPPGWSAWWCDPLTPHITVPQMTLSQIANFLLGP